MLLFIYCLLYFLYDTTHIIGKNSDRNVNDNLQFFLIFFLFSFIRNIKYIYFLFYLNTVCEGSIMIIECPTGKIRIEEANYGNPSDNECTTGAKYCQGKDSVTKVKSECDEETSCSIEATNAVFGPDPCPNIKKYLEVKFTCV